MRTILKRYKYKGGLDIIAPLKCGTRWLEGLDNGSIVHKADFGLRELSDNVHSGTTFIYRPVVEHLKSALTTELCMGMDIKSIINGIKFERLNHWSPSMYKNLYPLWEIHRFKFCSLKELSNITNTSHTLEYTSSNYTFELPTQWDSIDAVFESFPHNDIEKLKRAVMNEEMWLSMMVGEDSNTINRDKKNFFLTERRSPPTPSPLTIDII